MRKILYGLLFFIALLVSLYLTFPFERFVENTLCKKGIEYESVEFRRFPPVIIVKKFRYPSVPLTFDKLEVHPSVLTLFKPYKKFHLVGYTCGGKVTANFTYPLKSLNFKLEGINVSCLLKEKTLRVKGKVYGKGTLFFGANGKDLTGGRGSFKTSDLKISGLKFGIFSLPDVKVGTARLNYIVKGKNYVELKGEAKGKVDAKASGFMRVNLTDFNRTYLSLTVRVVLKEGPFRNKPFRFRIAGYLSNLSVR